MSKFLALNRSRFVHAFKEIEGDFVPWKLDDKAAAYEHVRQLGYRIPESLTFMTIEEALGSGSGRFVVKGAGGHSGKNVYILERLEDGLYLDLMASKTWTVQTLKAEASKRRADYWIVEEFVVSTVHGRIVPFDYKFDCFGDQIVAITQIDRNFWPPRVAIFDGAFVPLQAGDDYSLDSKRWKHGAPVVPLCASCMIEMARKLSISTDSAFVRVDLFDGYSEPCFGEFTFASGPPDVGMVKFSERVLSKYDDALAGKEITGVSGFDIDYRAFWNTAMASSDRLTKQHPEVFGRISAAASFGDTRYFHQIDILPGGRLGAHYKLCLALATFMAGKEELAFLIQELIRVRGGFISGDGREEEFVNKALEFHEARRASGKWHVARHAEITARRGDPDALRTIKKLADEGYAYAQGVCSRLIA